MEVIVLGGRGIALSERTTWLKPDMETSLRPSGSFLQLSVSATDWLLSWLADNSGGQERFLC
jgi:hypothetical protein